MKRYMQHLIRSAEIRTEQFMNRQDLNPESIQYGGIRGEIWEPKPTVYALTTALSVYLNPDSRFYADAKLLQAMSMALDFVERTQREDGSLDFPSCNFRSAPDTSFCFKRLYAAWCLIRKRGRKEDQGLAALEQKYLVIMRRALEIICAGGFHTPNHRWAITAALLQGAELFADEPEYASRLKARAEQYLAEGIDGDEDGEYAERSTGNYNAVVNNAMIGMYQATGDETFLGYVRRNLSMMLIYIDPDDTIFTQNSTRQDQGKKKYADMYFYQYLYLCSREDDPVFDGAAHKIIRDNMARGDLAPDCLHQVMLQEEMENHTFTHYGFPESYRKFFTHSGVLRVRKPRYAYTVLRGKSAFLFFQAGAERVYFKIGESYCDIRNFLPSEIRETEDGCVLKGRANGWYYLPFTQKQGTSDWWAMDHAKREKLINSRLDVTVTIRELDDGLAITVKTEGLDRLPLRLETCIPAGAVLENPHFWMKAGAGEGMILREGQLTIRSGEETLTLGDGFGEHEFHGHYSGEEINTEGYTIFCNAYTPVEKTIRIAVKEKRQA